MKKIAFRDDVNAVTTLRVPRFAAAMFAAVLLFTAAGVERIYTGTDGKWNAAANWSPSGVPEAGDVAKFNSSATITDDFALPTGNRVELDVASGQTLSLDGDISGAGGLKMIGAGTVLLNGDNSYAGGVYWSNGVMKVCTDTALGTGQLLLRRKPSANNWSTTQWVHFVGNRTIANDVSYGITRDYSPTLYFEDGTHVMNGNFSCASGNTYVRVMSGGKVTFNGTLTGMNYFSFAPQANAEIIYTNSITCSCFYPSGGSQSTAIVRVRGSITPSSHYEPNGTVNIIFEGPANQLTAAPRRLVLNKSTTFDVNGHAAKFTSLRGSEAGAILRSTTPATVTITQQEDASVPLWAGKAQGSVSLVVDGGTSGAKKQLNLSGAHTTTGDLVVTNRGAVAFTNAATWAGSKVRIAAGGTLEVRRSTVFSNEDLVVDMLDVDGRNAVFKSFEGAETTVKELWINGVKKSPGIYGSSLSIAPVANQDNDHFLGAGCVIVPDAGAVLDGTWTGAGDGVTFSAPDNWEGGVPVSTAGLGVLTIAGGSRISIPDGALFAGIVFAPSAAMPSFTFEDGGSFGVGVSGITLAHFGDVPLVVTNNADFFPFSTQTWSMPTNTAWVQNGDVNSRAVYDISKTGEGPLELNGGGDFFGAWRFKNGRIHPTNPRAFGTSAATAYFTNPDYTMQLYLTGVALDAKVSFNGADAPWHSNAEVMARMWKPFIAETGSTNTFNSKFTVSGGNFRPMFRERSRTVFAEGFSEGTYYWPNSLGDNASVAYMKTSRLGYNVFMAGSNRFTIEFHAPSNTWYNYATSYSTFSGRLTVKLFCEHAFSRSSITAGSGDPTFVVVGQNGYAPTFDMNGHDQEVQSMWGKDISKWTPCMITSDSPATWRVYQSEDVTLNGLVIAGAAGFSKAGAAKLTVAAPASTTTGALEVVEGELSLGSAASFASVGEVRLLGGTLSMPSANLNTAATLWVSGGKISLPAGVSQKVAVLWVYDSAADKWVKHLGRTYRTGDCAWVEGGGEVVVTGGGTTLIFK